MSWTKISKAIAGALGWGSQAWGSSAWGGQVVATWSKLTKEVISWTKL